MATRSGGAEVVWYSQRDGWGHLYLYDAGGGDILRQLTSGSYDVAEIQHVDEDGRWLYFTYMQKVDDDTTDLSIGVARAADSSP